MQSQRNTLEIYVGRAVGDGAYPVTARVLETNQSARSSMLLALSVEELLLAQRWLADGDANDSAVHDFGARLFDALFAGSVRLLYDQLAGDPDRPPAFWIVVDDPGIAQISWELLYDSRRPGFLALSAPFVRGLAIENPTRSRPVTAGPLRVMVASAFPSGLESLESNDEAQAIANALQQTPDGVQITELPHATLSRLQNALREAEQSNTPYHVLHLISHGYADAATGASAVILEDERGAADVVQPAAFAALLSGLGIQLVFLNACSSASMPANNLAPGFAQALLGAGIPILVGMQAPVTTSDALLFTAELYGSLADGRSVDSALLDVRRIAQQRSSDGRTAPAIPVCYTRIMPARLVNAQASMPASPAPAQIQPAVPAAPVATGTQRARRLWGVVAAIVALVVGIISGYVSMRDFFCAPPVRSGLPTFLGTVCDAIAPQEAPVVVVAPTATPQPRLTGDFKIAVAEFAPADGPGASDASAKASELAHQIYEQLHDDLNRMASDASVPFSIDMGLAPQVVGSIEGDTYQAQVDNAVRRAREINADLLIFGNLDASPDKTVVDAYFYLAPMQLPTAEEMAGAYPLTHVESTGNALDNMVTSSELRSRLLASADGMGRFLFGLGFFNRRQFNEAARWLVEAEQSVPPEHRKQRAVVELFLGSTAAQLGDLPLAHQSYQTALDLDPRFARALLGRGQIDFLLERVAGGCAPGATDVAAIQRALEDYQNALGLTADPLAAIPTKVNLYAGTAYVCLALAEAGDEYWELAQEHLEEVVADYAANGDTRLQYLAAQAQARLGALALALQRAGSIDQAMLASAEGAFEQAAALSRMPGEIALNQLWLAWIQASQSHCEAAQTHAQTAQAAFEQRAALDSTSPAYTDFATQYSQLRDKYVLLLKSQCPSSFAPENIHAAWEAYSFG